MFEIGQKVKMKDRHYGWVDCAILEIDQKSGSCLVKTGNEQGWTDLMSLKKFFPIENKAKSLYLEWDANSMNVFNEIEKHWKNLIVKPLNLQFMDRKIWVELDKHREFSVYPAVVKTVSIGRLNEVVGWRLDHDEKMICKHNNYFYTVKNLIVECQKVINERFWSMQ